MKVKNSVVCYVGCTSTMCMFSVDLALSKKLLVLVKCSELDTAKIAPAPTLETPTLLCLFLRNVVLPVNVRVLLRAVIPHPNLHLSLKDSHPHWLCMNSLFSARVMLVLCTVSAVPKLSWKEQLTSLVYSED